MQTADHSRHQGLRKNLVEILRGKGITDEAVLDAILHVPRHLLAFDSTFVERAYDDTAFPIGEGQTISQPYTVAFQTQLLQVKKGDRILEVGTGSGYQACILSYMGAKVFTVERIKKLFDRTRQRLAELDFRFIKCFYGDGYEGLPAYAPFDKIIVTAGAKSIPPKLPGQLKEGGILVIPVGEEEKQVMKAVIKKSTGELEEKIYSQFRFVPMLPGRK